MSATALYYPNVTIVAPRNAGESQDYNRTDINLLTTAALLWDDLEVIVPYSGFRVRPVIAEDQQSDSRAIHEAFEMLIRPRSLSVRDQKRVHKKVVELFANGVPDELKYQAKVDNYEFYPQKLAVESWDYLREKGICHGYEVQREIGLTIMSIAAEVCAGTTRKKVTNYVDAHEGYMRVLAAQNRDEEFRPDADGAYKHLVSLSIRSANAGAFPLKKVIEARKREDTDGLLPILRENYRTQLDKYVDRIKTATSLEDVRLIEREFEKSIERDFNELQVMLQLESSIPVLTVGASILALLLAAPITAGVAVAVGLPTFLLTRRKTLKEHHTSWLHKA